MSSETPKLFQPIKVGNDELKHRIVMAPLTRLRASLKTAIPSDWAIDYYTQRASEGGLVISEATFIAEELKGYDYVPGIYSPEQIAKWKKITDGVHSKGGKMALQLWVLGRVADPKVIPTVWSVGTIKDLSPSPHSADPEDKVLTPAKEEDLDRFVGYYVQAAKNAMEAGFDYVELQTNSNDRTDQYGGSLENRIRFPLRVINAVSDAVGPQRVGIRLSPFSEFQGMRMEKPLETFVPYVEALAKAQPDLAYVHAVEGRGLGTPEDEWYVQDDLDPVRQAVLGKSNGTKFFAAGGFTRDSAIEHAEKYPNDLVTFGRYFISNPDLVERIRNNWPFRNYERPTFYTQTAEGYIDWEDYSPEKQALVQDEAAPTDQVKAKA
ncbi:NADPH2 dehydrogenase [Cryptococcus wingfieldii CBS 7118]|uniref:NADPH2 dehydrogenase n=1 Tax=Cryptococcus wingfieldii CBS 7118 TaxID=1295528 RepID=A0A1E3JWI2_9TREE|nr:NADPH2 dehydrogenase [Cryptococcus wingfieldii CBS 7118]ODO05096.1 NADPH2 dehydrogenase [Cryptococcus wingfieldii CBS 7118]